jgi:threonine dehydrogenase-like Zn-dependent dehydrogenase
MKGRQILFTKPWQSELCEYEFDLGRLGPNEVAIQTEYSVISAATELAILSGNESWAKLPYVPGYGGVGRVIVCPPGAKNFREGDRVFSYTPHQTHVAGAIMVVPLCEGCDGRQAVFARLAGVSITALRLADAELGDWVAVYGLGLVGNLAAQLFTLAGCQVIGIDVSEKRLELARQCGIEHLFKPEAGLKEKLADLTHGEMCRTVVESTGVPAVAEQAARIASSLGEVILLGSPRGEYKADLTTFLNNIHLIGNGCITFKGAHEWRYPVQTSSQADSRHSLERNAGILLRLIQQRRLKVSELISEVASPSDCQRVYEGLRDRKDDYVGVVFDWTK